MASLSIWRRYRLAVLLLPARVRQTTLPCRRRRRNGRSTAHPPGSHKVLQVLCQQLIGPRGLGLPRGMVVATASAAALRASAPLTTSRDRRRLLGQCSLEQFLGFDQAMLGVQGRAPETPHAPGQRNTAAANRAALAAKSSAGRCASAHAGRAAAVRGQ